MKPCYECGATNYITQFEDKTLCEKCLIWHDYDEELSEYSKELEDIHVEDEDISKEHVDR